MAYSSLIVTRTAFQLTALSMAIVLSGCSGGGGGTVDSVKPAPCLGTNCGGTGGTGGGGTNPTPDIPVAALQISDIALYDATGAETHIITKNGVTAKVKVMDGGGKAIPNALVKFTGTNLGFGSSNGSVLTNANGEAVVAVTPTIENDNGSYIMGATVNYDKKTASANDYFYTLQVNNGGGTVVDVVKINDIVLYDTEGQPTRTITRNGATAKVKVLDGNGKGIPNALVTFAGTNVEFGSTNGAVITNENGEASLSVLPKSNNDTGTYSMTATVNYAGKTAATSNYFYSLQAVDVELANLVIAQPQLSSGASTLLTLITRDKSSGKFTNDVAVNFKASCGSFDNATVVSSNRGNVSATYKSIDDNGKLCTGTQTITATTPNGTGTGLSAEVNIAAIEATSLVYTTKEGLLLGAKSSGSASTSQVEFTVFSNGTPAANQQVEITLLRAPADFNFVELNNKTAKRLISDASGKVRVTVYPGDIPGPVELKASLVKDPMVFALSKDLAVATGRPTQDGITLGIGEQVLLNNSVVSTTITALLTDRQGNFVPPGTSISFVSEGGTITPTCATNTVGRCTVTFTSQNPRPAYGRVSVLAFVEGEKKYVDMNGNNVYDAGVDKLFRNLGISYRDDNENMAYDDGEFYYNRASLNGSSDCEFVSPQDIEHPLLKPPVFNEPNIAKTCNTGLDAILRKQVIMGFADSVPTLINIDYDASSSTITFDMYGNNTLTLPMPSKTTVAVTAEDRSDNKKDCKAEIIEGVLVVPYGMNLEQVYMQNGSLKNGFLDNPVVKYGVDVANCVAGDKVELLVTSPGAATKVRLNPYLPI